LLIFQLWAESYLSSTSTSSQFVERRGVSL
jgi:hypothetical protein